MDARKPVSIFIVEDNKLFAIALKAFVNSAFRDMGIDLHSFETGEECMKAFKTIKPDLVILDYNLNSASPEAADGLEILDKIKIENFTTSVIMLTGNDRIETARKSFRQGADDYVVKTGSFFGKIKRSIIAILDKKELELEREEIEKLALDEMLHERERTFRQEANKTHAAEMVLSNVQMAEAERTRHIVEEKNKDITDSINYAKRIQQATLPRKEDIYASLPHSFVLFKPKDIVSGDFYFFHVTDECVLIVAADCTGHGVPGAFMSMIGSEKLSDAVLQSTDTSKILKHLNKGIKNSLHQTNSTDSTRDGMDLAICSIDTKKQIVRYAGANRPFWLIRNGRSELEEIKATKKAIGGLTEDEQHFDSHELKLQKGDTFYIFSDGYADTFGGRHGKKLMTRKFKEILLDIQKKSMAEQEKHLDDFMENWISGTEQIDDILVIGIRL